MLPKFKLRAIEFSMDKIATLVCLSWPIEFLKQVKLRKQSLSTNATHTSGELQDIKWFSTIINKSANSLILHVWLFYFMPKKRSKTENFLGKCGRYVFFIMYQKTARPSEENQCHWSFARWKVSMQKNVISVNL